MKKIVFLMTVIASLGLASPTTVLAGMTSMTTEELKTLISDTTIFGTSSSGKKFIQIFSADGSLESGFADMRDSNGKWKPYETGTWKVKDGQLCNSYTKPKKRSGGCDKFFRTDDGKFLYKTKSGRQGSFDKIIPGRNPE